MVVSISKIPDRIQREIYIQECSRIMDISEQVLISTLAQLLRKALLRWVKAKEEYNTLEIVKVKIRCRGKVDVLYLRTKNNRDVVVVWR
jgi:DNA primase